MMIAIQQEAKHSKSVNFLFILDSFIVDDKNDEYDSDKCLHQQYCLSTRKKYMEDCWWLSIMHLEFGMCVVFLIHFIVLL